MAEVNPPSWLQARTDHAAQDYRRMLGSLVASKSGIVHSGDLAVVQNGTPNMSVNVAAGRAFILGSESANQGVYHVDNPSTLNLTIAAAHATNTRYDRIIAKVQDAEYSGATNAWSLAVVQGTPAASPSEPSLPANCIELARVTIAGADTSITNAEILDRRVTAQLGRASGLGGIVPTTSGGRPTANVSEGLYIHETDTDRLLASNGSDWVSAAAYTTIGPTFFAPTLSGGTATGYFGFANTGTVFVAPYPLTMLVTAHLQVSSSTTHHLYVIATTLGGTNISQGSYAPAASNDPGVSVDTLWRQLTVIGSTDIAAGANVGCQLGYKVDTGNANINGVLMLQYFPKVS